MIKNTHINKIELFVSLNTADNKILEITKYLNQYVKTVKQEITTITYNVEQFSYEQLEQHNISELPTIKVYIDNRGTSDFYSLTELKHKYVNPTLEDIKQVVGDYEY